MKTIFGVALAFLCGSILAFPWRGPWEWQKLAMRVVLLAPPIAVYFCGRAFAVDPGSHAPSFAFLIEDFILACIGASFALPIVLLRSAPTARAFTLMLGLATLVVTIPLAILADCEVTGVWL